MAICQLVVYYDVIDPVVVYDRIPPRILLACHCVCVPWRVDIYGIMVTVELEMMEVL